MGISKHHPILSAEMPQFMSQISERCLNVSVKLRADCYLSFRESENYRNVGCKFARWVKYMLDVALRQYHQKLPKDGFAVACSAFPLL